MKKLIVLTMLMVFGFSVQPAYSGAPAPQSNSTTMKVEQPDKVMAKKAKKAKRMVKMAKFFSKFKKKAGDSLVVALLLTFFLGFIGAHRVYTGGTPLLMLAYFGLSLIGIGGLLILIDLIMMIVDGDTSRYDGNDALLGFL